jgi:hypothetical protein
MFAGGFLGWYQKFQSKRMMLRLVVWDPSKQKLKTLHIGRGDGLVC